MFRLDSLFPMNTSKKVQDMYLEITALYLKIHTKKRR